VTDDAQDGLDGRGTARDLSALWNRRLFEGARDGIHIVDLDGQLIDCNAAFLEHLGYTWDEARRLRVWDWDPGESAERTPAALRRLSRADRPLDTTHRRKDGTTVDVELTFARVDFAGHGYVMAVARDATFRRQQERRQRELAELLRRVIEEVSSGIGLFDADGRCVLASASLGRIFDAREAPVPGLEALFGATYATIAPAVACALATGEVQRRDVDLRTSADRAASLVVSFVPVERGGRRHLLLTVQDVSEFRQVEHTLRAASARAEAATQAKSAFLANMSHELRTPMNAILGLTRVLLDGALDDDQRGLASTVLSSAESLLELLNQLLDLSKIEAGRIELESLDFSPHELASSVERSLQPLAVAKALTLTVTVDPRIPTVVVGDPTRVRQLLMNLLGNALKFTPLGWVRAHIGVGELAATHVELVLTVADSGIGIPAERLGALFQKFEQVDVSTTRRFGGTGLGLAITRELTRLMGGDVEVESEIGVGSTLRARFVVGRRARRWTETDSTPSNGVAVAARSYDVLAAEDNVVNQFVVRRLLESLGHRVDVVADGQGALAALATRRYDVVLMDCQMPTLDGYATARAVRAGASGVLDPSVPIIALTANAMVGDRERCLDAGMNDHLAKPIVRDALAQVLRRWAVRRRASS
jgi:PAS domain S-box-containing protein